MTRLYLPMMLRADKNGYSLYKEKRLQEIDKISEDQKATWNSHNSKPNSHQSKRRWRKPISCINIQSFSTMEMTENLINAEICWDNYPATARIEYEI
ncbi:hypothetical protein E2986_13726 [Frieseomelitta varia]|uniref:Uncharacterized protein n=1 Tax=Frieseomelitta varia TaxID=561572 RepID=A0A833VQJ8_9HYME|nr:hypothetical protein E2986_13726 [Frieseomelitta varia]